MSELLLIAASGLAREVLAMVRSSGPFDVIGILDDDEDKAGRVVDGAHVLGPIRDALKFPHALLLVCIGSGSGREGVVMRLRSLGLDEERNSEGTRFARARTSLPSTRTGLWIISEALTAQ